MKLLSYITLFALLFTLFSCGNSQKVEKQEADFLDFSDVIVQEIYKLQNERNAKGLIPFLKDETPANRYLAAMALASVQDSSIQTLAALAEMLRNKREDESIRAVAAYALGQTKSNQATQPLLDAFEPKVSKASFLVNAQILEAIGRCAEAKYLKYLSAAPDYLPTDTLMLEGQANGIYRYELRGITSNLGTNRMLALLDPMTYPASVRRIAANYFGRLPAIKFDDPAKVSQFVAIATTEKDNYTRMALALGLGKLPIAYEPLVALQDMARAENDPMVKANILRSLKQYDYVDAKPAFLAAIRDANPQLVIMASEYFIEKGIRNDVDLYYGIGTDSTSTNIPLKINMLSAALAHINYTQSKKRNEINALLIAMYKNSTNPYEKGMALKALSVFALNYQFIKDEMFAPNQHDFVKTAAVSALADIRRNPKLNLIMGFDYDWMLDFFKTTFLEVYEKGDVGMMGVTAEILRDPKLGYQYSLKDEVSTLKIALTKLKLPRDIETQNEIEKTIAFITGDSLNLTTPKSKFVVDWKPLQALTKDTKVIVKTSKGNFEMQLYPVEAPASVSNFIKLVNKGFYNNKTFHRVVPNFVAQGGCPRGDGWGSSDKTIRSELSPLKYDDAGWVGMASAGKDTETCQFFITHSPTPHLDGNYSIFAKVISGMNVVLNLTVGDKIDKIEITGNTAVVKKEK
jgi:cyclophilin family peptidyl-prolyl cis-trans isomerase/HEAT repeat protein